MCLVSKPHIEVDTATSGVHRYLAMHGTVQQSVSNLEHVQDAAQKLGEHAHPLFAAMLHSERCIGPLCQRCTFCYPGPRKRMPITDFRYPILSGSFPMFLVTIHKFTSFHFTLGDDDGGSFGWCSIPGRGWPAYICDSPAYQIEIHHLWRCIQEQVVLTPMCYIR
jgi:hypothetical protein